MQRLPLAGRLLSGDRWAPESHLGAVDLTDRRQEGEVLDPTSIHEAGRRVPQAAHRGREISAGHRSLLPAGGRCGGGSVRRNGAEDRERRPDDQRRLSLMRAIVRDTYGSPDVLALPHQALGFRVQAYGVTQQKNLFTRLCWLLGISILLTMLL